MRILVIGDLHGRAPRIPDVPFDCVFVPGDVCSDEGIKPLLLELVRRRKEGENDSSWWDLVSRKQAEHLLAHSLRKGRDTLSSLNDLGVPIYAIPGNWDWTGDPSAFWSSVRTNLWETELLPGLSNIINADKQLIECEGFSLIGYGRVNGPELITKRGYANISSAEVCESTQRYEDVVSFYSRLFSQAKQPVIFLAHNVPYGTSLDIIDDGSHPFHGMHYGSNVVRAIIEQFQPLATIGGHMHEHYGVDTLGSTLCLNAGFGSDKATIVTVSDGVCTIELLK